MADIGLNIDGFVIPSISDIRAGIEEDIRLTFGRSLPLGDKTILGHVIGIISERLGLSWEVLATVVGAMDPDQATDFLLQALCAITGTFAADATPSVATETLCGDDGTVVAITSVVSTASTAQRFDSLSTVTIALLPSWATTHAYLVGDRVTNAGLCFQCKTAGTSSGAGPGPNSDVGVGGDITDGSVHWICIGVGVGAVDVILTSENVGAVVAVSGDLTAIQTPVSGWRSARNVLDAVLGLPADTNETLRLKREAELAGSGSSTADALRAQLLKLTGVISATIFNNIQDVPDGNGVPAHAFESLVRGGDDQQVVDTIANNQPEGIATFGGSSGTHTDSEGQPVTIFYSRPTNVLIYVDITLTFDATLYPSDGDAEVKAAIALFGAGFNTDSDVDPSACGGQAFSVRGVRGIRNSFGAESALAYTDVIGAAAPWTPTTGYVATVGARSVVTNDAGRTYICTTSGTSAGSGGPTGTGTDIVDGTVHWYYLGNVIPISARQLAAFDTSRINVHSSAVTP